MKATLEANLFPTSPYHSPAFRSLLLESLRIFISPYPVQTTEIAEI